MVKKTSSASSSKTTVRKTTKKVATKPKAVAAKAPRKAKKTVSKKQVSTKVDYYPNRMTVAVSALAGTILVLVAVIAVLGSRS